MLSTASEQRHLINHIEVFAATHDLAVRYPQNIYARSIFSNERSSE
jgi:hypothetical protein